MIDQTDLSARIRIARSLCILGVVLVHVPPWRIDFAGAPARLDMFDLVFVYTQELLGRTSVPLLSAISGFLFVRTARDQGYAARVAKKLATLIAPLLLWNMLALAADAAFGLRLPANIGEWSNALIALTGEPAIKPLYFLRDIFVCGLLYPVIARAVRISPWGTLSLIAVATVSNVVAWLFIGSAPLMFFTLGVAIAQGRFDPEPGARSRRWIVLGAILLPAITTAITVWQVYHPHMPWPLETGYALLLLTERLFGASLFWILTALLLKMRLGASLIVLEAYIFFIFCSHVLWLGLSWRLFQHAGGAYGHPLYPVFYLTAPLTAALAGVAGLELCRAISPRAARLLSGGRLPQGPAWKRLLSPPIPA